uniref:Uncharacterized protein n=1 Tax=Rhizophagus irregularis (strain DAOM 181602 / DAOM 197198 / MUCL 43194) TaxID=747089 RepID=U9U3D2_RHIID
MILLGLCTLLLDSRYLELRFQEWWHLIVPKYDDIRFKKNYGNGFPKLTNLITNIESHSIFQSTGNRQQVPVELQLAIFLRRGSKDEIFSIRSHYGISEGTVYLYYDDDSDDSDYEFMIMMIIIYDI